MGWAGASGTISTQGSINAKATYTFGAANIFQLTFPEHPQVHTVTPLDAAKLQNSLSSVLMFGHQDRTE